MAARLKRRALGESWTQSCRDLEPRFLPFGTRTSCSHEGTNRTWDEGSLCRVIPCRACSTLRGANTRCAERGSVQRLAHFNVVRTLVVLSVVLFNVFSTLRGANARYAECGSEQGLAHFTVVRTPVVLHVVPFKVFSAPRGTSARCAACGSGQRGSSQRSCSCHLNAGRSCFTSAVYQRARPTRACSGRRGASSAIGRFSASVSAPM